MKKPRRGFAMLLCVLILAVIGVTISTTLLSLSISFAQTAGTYEDSQKAKATVQACGERAIQTLITSWNYTGSNSVTLPLQTCTYTVSTINTSTDLIQATSTVGQTTRRLLIKISIPQLTLLSWQEV